MPRGKVVRCAPGRVATGHVPPEQSLVVVDGCKAEIRGGDAGGHEFRRVFSEQQRGRYIIHGNFDRVHTQAMIFSRRVGEVFRVESLRRSILGALKTKQGAFHTPRAARFLLLSLASVASLLKFPLLSHPRQQHLFVQVNTDTVWHDVKAST